MRILLINVHSSCNAGDHALIEHALCQLEAQFPGAHFTLAMNDPESYEGNALAVPSFTAWVKPIRRGAASAPWRWIGLPGLFAQSMLALARYRLTGRAGGLFLPPARRALLEAYLRADLVVSTAGNFIYSSSRIGLPFLLSLYSITYACLAGKPVYTLPQTLGPLYRRWEQALARRVLSRLRLLLVRDPISASVLESWQMGERAGYLLPDLAFAAGASGEGLAARAVLREAGLAEDDRRPWLGVTVVHWGAQRRSFEGQGHYEEAVEAAIRSFLAAHGGRVVLFAQVQGPTQAEDDRVPARRLLARLQDLPGQVLLLDRQLSPALLKAAYGQMDLFLGTRLHSNIFALTEGVPVVAIGYQYKTRGVMRMLGLEPWVVDIEEVEPQALAALLEAAWSQRAEIRRRIADALPPLQEMASRAGGLLAADFRRLAGQRTEGERP